MEINATLVDHLAKLSRLHLSDNERLALMDDLTKMIAFVEKLKEIDTTGVSPLLHMSNNENAWREDIVKESISTEAAFLNAPHKDHNFFKVPKVIQK